MKKAAEVFVALFILLTMTACSGRSAMNRAVEELNRNCDVPFALRMPETELKNTDAYEKVQGFGGYTLESGDVSFTIGGYPDCLDDYHVVGFRIKSQKYTLLDLQVGCSTELADKVLKQYGYAPSAEGNRYTKNGVNIAVGVEEGTVTYFHVFVEVTNKQNVVF